MAMFFLQNLQAFLTFFAESLASFGDHAEVFAELDLHNSGATLGESHRGSEQTHGFSEETFVSFFGFLQRVESDSDLLLVLRSSGLSQKNHGRVDSLGTSHTLVVETNVTVEVHNQCLDESSPSSNMLGVLGSSKFLGGGGSGSQNFSVNLSHCDSHVGIG